MNDTHKHPCNDVMLAIPVYNERETLNAVLDQVAKYPVAVVALDDGSTDGSREILGQRRDVCAISHRQNCGYGCTLQRAFHFALGCGFEWVITMDCDLQHEPAHIPDFLAAIRENDADIISGSRYLLPADEAQVPPERRTINTQVTRMINQVLSLDLTDAFCGFKAYRMAAIQTLRLSESGYAFPLEFWVQAAAHRLRIREIPVELIYVDPNRSFGLQLDDAAHRLAHYKQVFLHALRAAGLAQNVNVESV